jgi:hypothetical protein
VEDLNIPLSPIDKSSRQKSIKKSSELLHTLNQMGIIAIYRILHPTTMQYILFSASHGSFSKIDILGQKTSLNKFKKIEHNTSCITSNHNRVKLNLNNKRNHIKYSNTWTTNNRC